MEASRACTLGTEVKSTTCGESLCWLGLAGTVLGLSDGLDWWEPDWWSLLFFALTAAGIEMVFWEASRFLGALLFASGVLGWVSLLTDPAFSGVLVPRQPVHVAFAPLFCLSCLAWGVALFREASQFAKLPRERR